MSLLSYRGIRISSYNFLSIIYLALLGLIVNVQGIKSFIRELHPLHSTTMDTNDTLDIPFEVPEVVGALRKTLLEES